MQRDLPSSTIPKPPPHLVEIFYFETTYQPMDVEGGLTSDAFGDLSERADPDKSLKMTRAVRLDEQARYSRSR